ncbi:MAG: hypothetical protein GX387_05770 [Clostridium sp.]|mgnify:CR=1 FL=1|jgi:hypothetical protein|nr:hypothetical protein [Clostridium sp.]
MPWVISFFISWILFFTLVDYKELKRNIFGGIAALILGSIVDWGGQKLNLYQFYDVIIPWAGCSAFYKFGPILVIGILFSQSIPKKLWMQTLNILVFSLLYLFLEALIINVGVAEYVNWHILASFLFNVLTFSTLTYFSQSFLKNNRA